MLSPSGSQGLTPRRPVLLFLAPEHPTARRAAASPAIPEGPAAQAIDPSFVPEFACIAALHDASIQRILGKTSGAGPITALVRADRKTEEAICRNLSGRLMACVVPTVSGLERGDACDLMVGRSRNASCEALMEVVRGREGGIMAIRGEWIRFGEASGYYARPERATGPLPGVLVVQEVMGVNGHIEDVTRRLAAAGYAALAPDLFARDGKRPDALTNERIGEAFGFAATLPPGAMFDPASREAALAKLGEAERGRIAESFGQVFSFVAQGRAESLMGPLRSAFHHLREERAETRGGRTGCVGFCMGGGLSALLACEEPELSGAAVFYGMAPPAEKITGIACPVIAFYGSKDQRVNAGIPGFRQAMHAGGKSYESHVYEGASHAFFNDDGPSYDANAARDSWTRLLAFFSKVLSG